MDDSKLVDMLIARDEAAITHIAEKYGKLLQTISYQLTGDAAVAEECVNDTYLQAWNRIPPDEPRTYLTAYLAKIVRAVSINRYKKEQRTAGNRLELTEELEQCIPDHRRNTEAEYEATELARAIETFLRAQTEEKSIMFVKRYFYLEPMDMIAAEMGCRPGKVRTTLFRMRAQLMEYLEKEGYV